MLIHQSSNCIPFFKNIRVQSMQCFNLAIHTYMWPLSSNHCVDFHFCSLSADIIDYVIICYIFAVLCVLYTCLKKIAKVRSKCSNKIVARWERRKEPMFGHEVMLIPHNLITPKPPFGNQIIKVYYMHKLIKFYSLS